MRAIPHMAKASISSANWDPGAYFGIYKPDSFWFTEARRQAAQ